jgi:YrbI family 3-deoxy-D-manno-octulosonate 8-phosphate phosphatase
MDTKIKVFLTDVDGVLTDAGMYYTASGDEFKKFNTHDGMGMVMLQKSGVKTGMLTTEDTPIVKRRAEKLKVDYLYQGVGFGGKLAAAKEICSKEGITLAEVAYIGDDINCIELLQSVGLAACPSNATTKVKAIPGIIHLTKSGGDGAVREFIDTYILKD